MIEAIALYLILIGLVGLVARWALVKRRSREVFVQCIFVDADSKNPLGDKWSCSVVPSVDSVVLLHSGRHSVICQEWLSAIRVQLSVRCIDGFEER